MSITDYISNLNRLKQLAVDNWGELTEIERQIFDSSYDWLIDNLEIKRGEVVVDEDLSKSMDQFLKAVVGIVNDNGGVQSKLTSFLSDLKNIQKNNIAFHATTNNFNIDIAGVKEVQKTVVEEVLNQYLGNGLNSHFAAPLRDGIFRNLLAGANMKQVREVLRNYILGGQDQSGKLGQYLNQTAQQAVDSYQGAINQQLKATFTFTGYIISGSLIETSSRQCIYAVDNSNHGYLSFKDWETVLTIARENPKARLIPGTNIDNLPINKLHWGCRHDFTPIIKKEAEKPLPKVEQKPEAKPVNKGFTPATSIKEVQDKVRQMFGDRLGLDVGEIEGQALKNSGVEKMNRYLKKLDELTSEYKISDTIENGTKTDIYFDSTQVRNGDQSYGFVAPGKGYRSIAEINFGDSSDSTRVADYQPSLALLMPKSRVDKENEEIATAVHEFGHVLSIAPYQNFSKTQKEFWRAMIKIRDEYQLELGNLHIAGENKDKEILEIYLGNYANYNINEFMAEGFTEYKLRKIPSKYAEKIGLLIDKYFKNE